jgi:hypothetical protein
MELRTSILKVAAYFDLFHYPLTLDDIRRFLEVEVGEAEVRRGVEMLVRQGRLYRLGAYYSLQNEPALVERRLRGEAHADELLEIAYKNAKVLYQFPYVRGIFISGSLSKRVADEKADIDYFLVTKSNRVWIARTILLLYRRLASLTGHLEHYCLNYWIDEDALEVEEKNIFTAIELFTLLPARGGERLGRFFQANSWASAYLPGYAQRAREMKGVHRSSLLKRIVEALFNNRLGDLLDNYLRRVTERRWIEKEENGVLDRKGTVMTMLCSPHYSRPNPNAFQKRILDRYNARLEELTDKGYFFLKEII